MNLSLSSITSQLSRWLSSAPGVRIEDRRWQRSINALRRDCEGLKRRIGGSQCPVHRR